MDKALLDYEVSIDADCKLLTVGKPFAIEGNISFTTYCFISHVLICFVVIWYSQSKYAGETVDPLKIT